MRIPFISPYFLFFILVFSNLINGQTSSSIIIKDHNQSKSPIIVDCNYNFVNDNHGITLTAEYPDIKNPVDYTVSSINFAPYGNFSDGKEIKIDKDDKWSEIIQLPFDFCFYGNKFKSIVVGDNGVVSFNAVEYASTECPYTIAGSIPNVLLMRNTIFGAYHDMTNDSKAFGCANTGDCGKITIGTYGTAPFRSVVINYYNMNHFNCEKERSTLQIILYETTNIIDVFIKDKPYTCEAGNEKRALIGLTNGDEQNPTGVFPPNRNTGKWEAHDEAWRFTPKEQITPLVKWYDSNNKTIGTGNNITVYPTSNTSYKAEVFYNACSLTSLAGTVQVVFNQEYPTAKKIDYNECFDGIYPKKVDFISLALESIGSQNNINYSIHNTMEEAINSQNPQSGLDEYFMTSKSKTFYLRVEKSTTCFSIAPLTINLYEAPNIKNNQEIELCLDETKNPTTINFQNYNSSIEGYKSWMKMEYYYSYQDATNQSNPIGNLSVKLPSKLPIFIRVSNIYFPECFQIISTTFYFYPKIELPILKIGTCEPIHKEYRDLTIYEQTIPNHEKYKFSYYNSTNSIAISNPTSYPVSTGDIIYVKITNYDNAYCMPIGQILFVLFDPPVKSLAKYVCDNNDEGEISVNLDDYFKEMAGTANISLIGYYSDASATNPISNIFKVTPPSSIAYVKFHDNNVNCNFILPITLNFIAKKKKISSLEVCDMGNDGIEKYSLHNLNSIFLADYPAATVKYYDSSSFNNPITEIFLTGNTDIYVKVDLINACSFTYKITLVLINHIFAETKDYTVKLCDNNSDNVEIVNLSDYDKFLINSTIGYKFTYFKTYDDAHDNLNPITNFTNYTINFSDTIYVRINDSSSCFNISKLTFQDINSLEVVDYVSNLCNYEDNPPINLMEYAQNEMLKNNISDVDIKFYYSEEGANKELLSDLLPDSQITNFPINASKSYIWVRFNSKINNCYTVRLIEINIIPLPKLVEGEYLVCDDNFDGTFSLWLNNLNYVVIADPQGYSFSYFNTLEDAENNTNPIANADKKEFIIDSFTKDIYVKATNSYNCSSTVKVTLYTLNKIPIDNTPEIINCDDDFDGITTFNLTAAAKQISLVQDVYYEYYKNLSDAQNQNNKINNPENYKNIIPNNDKVYVRITSNSSAYCPNIGIIKLKVLPVPKSSLKSSYKICPDGETLTLNADSGDVNDYYEWSTGEKGINFHEITINAPGNYWVTITGSNGCKYTYKTLVYEYEKVIIKQVIAGKDYIKIIAEGPTPLEYSMDNILWQDNNTFNNLEPATYSLYVRSKVTPCKPASTKGIIFKINNLITPNGDGYNDIWSLCGLDLFNGTPSHIQIFDRYGKVVFEETSTTCFSWNGHYLGRVLPTNSYWYIINIADGRKFTGWILLKNYDSL